MKLNFVSVKLNFVSVKLNFASVQLNFASVKLNFVNVKLNFVSVKLNFVCVKLNFVCVKLNFELNFVWTILGNYINKNYISTHIFNEIKWLVDCRKDPAYHICSNNLHLHNELNFLLIYFTYNGYHSKLVHSCVLKILDSAYCPQTILSCDKFKFYVSFPFLVLRLLI